MWRKFTFLIVFMVIFASGALVAHAKEGYPKTITVNGEFLGVQEGDYVYAGIKHNNAEIWVSCDEESITKFFGPNAKGKKVSLTYTIDWVYIESAGEEMEWTMCKSGHVE